MIHKHTERMRALCEMARSVLFDHPYDYDRRGHAHMFRDISAAIVELADRIEIVEKAAPQAETLPPLSREQQLEATVAELKAALEKMEAAR